MVSLGVLRGRTPDDLPMGYVGLKRNLRRYIWLAYMGFWSRTRMSSSHSSRLSAETRSIPGGRLLWILPSVSPRRPPDPTKGER